MKRTILLLGLLLMATLLFGNGCASLVGGSCAEGFIQVEQRCEPEFGLGGGGAGASGSQGSGAGSMSGPGGTGGHSSSSGDSTTSTSSGGSTGSSGCMGSQVVCEPDGCVDTMTDYRHCGACDNYCPSELCVDGSCVGTEAGHIVLIGMNYVESNEPSRRLLGNSVLLPPDLEVSVLEYREHVNVAQADKVMSIAEDIAFKRGRSLKRSQATGVPGMLQALAQDDVDVVLLHDQPSAPAGALAPLGLAMAMALDNFAAGGGVVVILASNEGVNQMPSFVAAAGLLNILGAVPVSGALTTVDLNDAIAFGVASSFLARPTTVSFLSTEIAGGQVSFVVADTSITTRPVVIHRAAGI
jgi:hypothetical protein